MKNAVKTLFAILGVLFVAIVVTSLMRPLLSRAAMSIFSSYATSSYLLSFAIRMLPLVAVFSLAGFTCTIMIDSARPVAWAVFAVILGAMLSPLLYSNSLAAPVPFRGEIEIHLSYAVPLVGLAFGALIPTHLILCHCEKRSDEAIFYFTTRLPRSLRSLAKTT